MAIETREFELFELYLCQVGAARAYLGNIRELARLIGPSDRDIALAIDRNAVIALEKASAAIGTHSEFAALVGYKYLRRNQ